MLIQIHVEEESMEAALYNLCPRMRTGSCCVEIIRHNGKPGLLRNVCDRLKGIRWRQDEIKVIILVDQDQDDCLELKAELQGIVENAGLRMKQNDDPAGYDVVTRIVIEELEAWFFGDTDALHFAYPRIPATLRERAAFRDPDHIAGGTAERLEHLLIRHHYYSNRMPKIEVARLISRHMDPDANRSHSFCLFRDTFRALCEC